MSLRYQQVLVVWSCLWKEMVNCFLSFNWFFSCFRKPYHWKVHWERNTISRLRWGSLDFVCIKGLDWAIQTVDLSVFLQRGWGPNHLFLLVLIILILLYNIWEVVGVGLVRDYIWSLVDKIQYMVLISRFCF